MVMLWRIWKEQNTKVFTGTSAAAAMIQQMSRIFLTEWQAARQLGVCRQPRTTCCVWHPPAAGVVKINSDVALFGDTRDAGLGMVIHDANGSFVRCRSMVIPGIFKPVEVEAMGVLEALSWVKYLGYSSVVIEMDAQVVYNALLNTEHRNNVFGDVISACKEILRVSPLY
ncbi:hypothetical protein ACS0TY_011062 [Phlomoides rotata]